MLEQLYKKYKARNKNLDKYSTTQYFNYLDAILSEKRILTLDNLKNLKEGSQVHYLCETIIGKNLYNAKVISIGDDYIIIKPTGWKNKGLKFNLNDEVYLCKGYI